MNPLNPYIVLDVKNVAVAMRLIPDPGLLVQLRNIAAWLDGNELDQDGISDISCFTMSIASIISIVSGLSMLPICVSDMFVDNAFRSNGACPLIIAALPADEKRNVLITRSQCQYGPNNTTIPCQFPFAESVAQISALTPGYPSWMFQMTYMVKFGLDVRSGWGKLPQAFELVYRRIMRANNETPPWAVQMLKGLVTSPPIPLTSNNVLDMDAAMPNHWMPVCGETSGVVYPWFRMGFSRTGMFPWTTKHPSSLFFCCFGPPGAGKTHAQGWFYAFGGHMPIAFWEDGTKQSWYEAAAHPISGHTLVFIDDNTIGLVKSDKTGAISEEECSRWKRLAGTRHISAPQAERRVKKARNDDPKNGSVMIERLVDIPGCVITANDPIFSGVSASEQAVASRFIYQRIGVCARMTLEHQPSNEFKDWSASKIREQFYWMQMIGLAHSAIGVQLTSPVAEPIFSMAAQHILTITRGALNLANNGRDHERFIFFLDWCITQRFVNCIMASGIGPQDVPIGTPLSSALIADVIASSCEVYYNINFYVFAKI